MILIIKHLQGGDYITPNICLNIETGNVVCKPYEKPLSFPIYLNIGDNGENGKKLYKYIKDNLIYDDIYSVYMWKDGYNKVFLKTESWIATYLHFEKNGEYITAYEYEIIEKYNNNLEVNHEISLNKDGYLYFTSSNPFD